MELRDYIKIIGRHKWIFWGIVIIAVAGTIIFTKLQPTTYLASTTLTVTKGSSIKQGQVGYYLYDNYYNQQASGLFSMVVTSWYGSPSVIQEVYQKAGYEVPEVSQGKIAKAFKAIRIEPATINVSYSDADKTKAEKLVLASADIMQEKTNELSKADTDHTYDIVKTVPITSVNEPDLLLYTLIGLIGGVLLGLILALGVDYFGLGKKEN